MIHAILFTSNSGFTKQYAELLSKATGLPAYNTANSIPPAMRGKPILYLGWLMAGCIQGYKKAAASYDVRAVCQVGMASFQPELNEQARKKYKLTVPVFYLQGGFDINRLSGIYKLMMQVMSKKIIADLSKVETRTPEQDDIYQMATVGRNCVNAENLREVLAWIETIKD
ncbi:MAG: hypothetical protein RRZ24_04530 [Clostridia bacterium]